MWDFECIGEFVERVRSERARVYFGDRFEEFSVRVEIREFLVIESVVGCIYCVII